MISLGNLASLASGVDEVAMIDNRGGQIERDQIL
jgi:hypothetical protein